MFGKPVTIEQIQFLKKLEAVLKLGALTTANGVYEFEPIDGTASYTSKNLGFSSVEEMLDLIIEDKKIKIV